MIKLSKTSKMPCKSFALPAGIKTCIGMFNIEGKVKDVCKGCYAMKGSYSWRSARNLRDHNLKETKENLESFHDDMIMLLKREKNDYFRWFDSGDFYDNDLLYTITSICRLTPEIKHFIPTKAREHLDQDLWEKLEALPNVTLRYSSPSVNGYYESIHGSTVIQKGQNIDESKVFKCMVGVEPRGLDENGKQLFRKKCEDCRACWDTPEKVIAYTHH